MMFGFEMAKQSQIWYFCIRNFSKGVNFPQQYTIWPLQIWKIMWCVGGHSVLSWWQAPLLWLSKELDSPTPTFSMNKSGKNWKYVTGCLRCAEQFNTTSLLLVKIKFVRDSGLIHLTGNSIEVSWSLLYSFSWVDLDSPKSETFKINLLSSLQMAILNQELTSTGWILSPKNNLQAVSSSQVTMNHILVS